MWRQRRTIYLLSGMEQIKNEKNIKIKHKKEPNTPTRQTYLHWSHSDSECWRVLEERGFLWRSSLVVSEFIIRKVVVTFQINFIFVFMLAGCQVCRADADLTPGWWRHGAARQRRAGLGATEPAAALPNYSISSSYHPALYCCWAHRTLYSH